MIFSFNLHLILANCETVATAMYRLIAFLLEINRLSTVVQSVERATSYHGVMGSILTSGFPRSLLVGSVSV